MAKIKTLQFQIGFLIVFSKCFLATGQNYEVADIDCAIGTGGKELLTARLRRPDGFRGTPIFADDRGQSGKEPLQELVEDLACQIIVDKGDVSGRVFKLRITDFSQCGVMKRNGFIHVRVWFPQLPGVVMLSDQEVIIMCKPPAATIVQSKTAGFAGSIPTGARISGIVEESPGRLEYEVALYRETAAPSSLAARSSSGVSTTGSYITGQETHELPVDQAVPIGTRLQLRAKINPDSSWTHAKLMEVSVSPDPKNPDAEGSVALVRDGCRNPELASIIPKQPYRYKERTNEVVLDFEAFLLSNMADRSTLWLHTQIKACMEAQDCHPQEFCMDVYQPSGYGRRKRSISGGGVSSSITNSKTNATSIDYSAPLSQHWSTYADEIIIDNGNEDEKEVKGHPGLITLPLPKESNNVHKEDIGETVQKYLQMRSSSTTMKSPVMKVPEKLMNKNNGSTNFGDNIGFSVIMPSDYYRSTNVLSTSECRGWATATLVSLLAAVLAVITACAMSFKGRGGGSEKEKALFSVPHGNMQLARSCKVESPMGIIGSSRDVHHKYARDPSIYRS